MTRDYRKDKPKPIRKDRVIGRPFWRIPEQGYQNPRLNPKKENLSVVGFVHDFREEQDDE